MAEQLDQLIPIIDIIGLNGVKASYSESTLWDHNRGVYTPGWTVEVNGTYKGAKIKFSEEALSLDDAAQAALRHLKSALGLH